MIHSSATSDPEREARSALARDPKTSSLAEAPFEPLPGGFSNHAWRADHHGQRYFVRLSPRNAERLGVDRHSECALLQAAAAAGLAPAVVRCAPADRLLVTRFVSGRTWTREDAVRPHNVRRLRDCLRRLHALPLAPGVQAVDFAAQADRLEGQSVAVPPGSDAIRQRAREVFAALRRESVAPRLCHNDLHHLNLVDDGDRLWLVDWEYGGVGDPHFDVAAFLCQHDCGDDERRALLDALPGDPTGAARRLALACWAFDYVQWLWYRAWVAGDATADRSYAERASQLEARLGASVA